jgi:hypothetical protein
MDWVASLAERRIREAIDRGEFDDLPGAGRPVDLGAVGDDEWWLRRYLRRENVDLSLALPPSVALRREADAFPDSLLELGDEARVRAVLEDYNARVVAEYRRVRAPSEPSIYPRRVDVGAVVAQWRERRARR